MEIALETDTETAIVSVSLDDVTTATRPEKSARKRSKRRRRKRRSPWYLSHLNP